MLSVVESYIKRNQIKTSIEHGITIVPVPTAVDGTTLTISLLSSVLTPETLLLLSGGRTPKELYTALSVEKTVTAGAVGLIDERFGNPFHENSNELMIRETGLLAHFEQESVPFHGILEQNSSRSETAKRYEQTIRELFSQFKTRIGILGIGLDGHTAGIPAECGKLGISEEKFKSSALVAEYAETQRNYGQRITITYTGLTMLDCFLVLVFGADKEEALARMFSVGSEESIPARFYKRSGIAERTLIITDQYVQ